VLLPKISKLEQPVNSDLFERCFLPEKNAPDPGFEWREELPNPFDGALLKN